jgi:GT2 family glycosyltransferase
MKVTVVIPNYNGENFIEACLKSLIKQTYKDFKVIVVDNGSSDRSCQIIENMADEFVRCGYDRDIITLVKNRKNTGFCGGVNIGIEKCTTPYVILLNNDTELFEDFIEKSIEGIEKSKKIFSVSPMMIQMYNKNLLDNAGDGYTAVGWAFAFGLDAPVEKYDFEREIFSSCAGAAIYRTDILKKLGLFDENHFAYLEDLDIGYRARIYGFKNMYNPKAKVYHAGSGTSGSRHNIFKISKSARNNVYVIYKNMPLLQFFINMPFILAGCVVKWLYFKRAGKEYGKAYMAGLKEGILRCRQCKKIRYNKKNLIRYIKIELLLIKNTFIYAKEIMENKRKM